MRITSGLLKNRRFEVADREVRPTKEKVREALFSSLGGSCSGLRALDLFAGAGSLGLEAWSRGADRVVFVEKSGAVFRVLRQNAERLSAPELGETTCVRADALEWLERSSEAFDLIFVDPPYDSLRDTMSRILSIVRDRLVLTSGGRLVYEFRASDVPEIPGGWETVRDKVYGKTRMLTLCLQKENGKEP